MTTNLTPSENIGEPKQLWEIYEQNDYIDAKDNQMDWRVGYIIEKNPVTKIFKVRFDGWSAKYDELFKFTSGKLIDFRSVVVGYTGQRKHPGIRTDWKFTLQDHLERIEKFKEFVSRKQKTAREINQFFRGHNYFYIDFLMTRNYQSLEAVTAVMQYFKLNIQFCVQYLKNIDPEFVQYYRSQQIPQQSHTIHPESAMVNAFYQILDTLYILTGSYQRLNSFFDNAVLIKKYLNIDFEKNVKRYYQIYIVQQFMTKGGFEVIQELIQNKLENSKCVIPFLFLKSIASLYNGLSSQLTYQDQKPWLQKLVEITRKNISKLTDKDVKDLNKSHVTDLLENIKILFDDNTEKREEIQNWALETQVKFCKLMILCPFFEKKLKGVIGLIEIAEKNKMQPQADYFVKLLLEHEILECLFSYDNAEIIKKSADFCKALFFIDIFPKKSIYKIWNMRIGKHQAAMQQIYSLISVIPSKPSEQEFHIQLFEQISNVKAELWDEDYIKMIKEYSLSAIGWAGPEETVTYLYGFNILYKYLLMKKSQFALTSFVQLLDRLEKTEIISKFVKTCFKKIESNDQSHIHVLVMLKMISQQICSFKDVQQDYSGPIIKDILKHTNESQEIVQKKLELLSEITKIMATIVTFEQFIELWNKFQNQRGQKAFLNWILKKKEGGKVQLNNKISTEIRGKIFETIWSPDYDYSSMSEKQAEIFTEFFRSINIIKGNIKRFNSIIKIDNLQLDHLDKIWKAFQQTSQPKIAEMLADLLAELHMCPTKLNENEKEQWIKKLILELSNKLQLAYQQSNVEKVNRFLLVLKKIIDRDQQLYNTKQTKYSMMKDYSVIYKANKEEKLIRFNVGGFCYDFKKLVCDRFKIPFKKCKLSCKGEIIRYQNYFKTMIETSFSIGSPFQLEIISGEIPSIKQCINSELQLFFQLLGDKRLERSVWEIVSRLPIAREFMLKIEHSQKPWEQINDPSIYKQLYMMRVMGLMGDNWWQLFTKGDGLPNLVKKFSRISTSTRIQRQYLKMLLEAIDKCLSLPGGNRNINLSELIINMFKAVQSLLINLDQEKVQNKRNSVEVLIVTNVFRISEKLQKQVNVISVLLRELPNFQELLLKGLVKTNFVFVRKQFVARMIIFNQFIQNEDSEAYLSLILGRIFDIVRQTTQPQQTQQYFEYTASLIKSTQENTFSKYLSERNPQLLARVKNSLVDEKPEQSIDTINYMQVGYLQLMKQLIKYGNNQFKQNMSRFVLHNCFFTHFENEGLDNKCKSREARKAAFSLLRSILQDGKNMSQSLSLLSDLHKGALWRTRKLDDWTLTPGDKLKSSSGFVGLKNLGCTCYMNSFFQQLFMVPEFRQAILECDDPIAEQQVQTENVLFQVKKMFFNLQESEKKFYVPNQFCIAFKNYQGQPTNVHEQMDIDQFSGMLFDRLQNQMKGTHHQNVIKDFFGGVFSNQIICKGCPHFSETQQSFLSVSLSVKNKKNIYQSLDTMIKGDTLDGDNAYFCQRCNKKVSAVKRVCLKKLPDHLMLTLKRFEFDFETMNKIKINDYCEFPNQLNVKEYSQQFLRKQQNPDKFDEEELLPDSYYDYVLKGVAIHLGYADSGHYYSYINDRKPNGKWFEFNDTVVRSFDPKRLPDEAFGGEVGTFEIKEKIKNAYMLIYQRKTKVNQFTQYTKLNRRDLLKTPLYGKLSEQIRRENVIQKVENILFSDEYTAFAFELLKKVRQMPEKSAIQLYKYVILVYLTVTIREKDQGVSFHFLKKLHQSIHDYPEVVEWIVNIFSAQKSLLEFFKNNPAKEVKKLLASWIIDLTKMSRPEFQHKFIDSLLVYTTQSNQNSYQFCYILFELMKDEKLCGYAISRNIVGRLLENLIRKEPGNFQTIEGLYAQESIQTQIGTQIIIEKTQYEINKKLKPIVDNSYLWGILSQVVQMAKKEKKNIDQIVSDIQAQYMFLAPIRIFKILEESKNKFQIRKITNYITYFAEKDQKFCNDILAHIYKGISEFQSKRYRQFFILFKKIIQIDDKNKQIRNRKGLAYVVKALKQNQKFAFDSNIIQQWIMKTLKKNRYLQKILVSEKDILEYLTVLATKKIPTEQICRKNTIFLENSVNKYHGIKMLKSIKKYIELSKQIQKFYLDLAEKKIPKADEWDSDDDLAEQTLQKGNIVAYFDQKDVVDFIEAKVQQIFLNRIWISVDKSKIIALWKDDERLTSNNRQLTQDESSEEILYSENTTQMDPEDDLDEIN